MITIMIISFFILLFLNVPIAFVIGIVNILMLLLSDVSLEIVVQRMFAGVDSFTLLAIPLFILAGNIMGEGGLTRRLLNLANVITRKMAGGLGMTGVVTSALFGTISGSTVATTYAVGSILVPSLKEEKYSNSFIAAIMGPSGVLGLIIPPSITMVILGVTADISIGQLFVAGILPGMVLTLSFCIYVAFMSKKMDFGTTETNSISRKEVWKTFQSSFLSLLSPVFILGSIFSGLATATEAAVIAVAYSFILSIYYKQLTIKKFKDVIASSAITSATILIIISAANSLTFILTANRVPEMISSFFLQFASTPILFLLMVSVILLVLGMFLDVTALIVLLAPIFMPVALEFGIDPIHFGMVLIMNFALANVTPPVGLSLIAGAGVTDKNMGIEDTFPYILHVIGILIIVVLAIILIPGISTMLPNLLY